MPRGSARLRLVTLTRLKNSRFLFLPLVLAALTLRVLIPSDVAPTSQGLAFTSTVCSNEGGKTEIIEIPGDDSNVPHCEYCVAPLLGAPLALPRLSLPTPVALLHSAQPPTVSLPSSLLRAQSARAPPTAS